MSSSSLLEELRRVPNPFPSLKTQQMLSILRALGYEEAGRNGSHRKLTCAGRPRLTFAFHDGVSIAPGVVRDILIKQVGLDKDEALKVVRGDK
ncbi:type II toxin-antitoxin system HicA family toxin [Streptosporangium sp. NPDC006007]|uniref:type II toxin-antitoxin system HicA family toxin n=1 Tax=Streptosporangium sp. NPDC006007 TaxID=3154575 RepID=UPI0033BAAD3A